jgi:excisionase family DNA binding protein
MASTAEQLRELLTPDQAADYLQVDRDTIYRYIRDGLLFASKLGRAYRIPRSSIDSLLLATRTRSDITLRDYSQARIAGFLDADKLDEDSRRIVTRFREEKRAG